MNTILEQFTQCVLLKKRADTLGILDTKEKLKLADDAINLSFGVIGGLIDKVSELEKKVNVLSNTQEQRP